MTEEDPFSYHTTEVRSSFNRFNQRNPHSHSCSSARLETHHENTMPVFVNYLGRLEVIICTTTESFAQFMSSVQRILGAAQALHACKVRWDLSESAFGSHSSPTSHSAVETVAKDENFPAILRMMQSCPGKGVFYVE